MTTKILEEYLSSQKELIKARHRFKEAKTKLTMVCRRIVCSQSIDKDTKLLATILLMSKPQND